MDKPRPFLLVKAHALQRHIYWHQPWMTSRHIRVSEFPKSGGTWFCEMLSEATSIPFPRNQFLPLGRSIQHSHYPYTDGLEALLAVVRDGRDVMVSAYHHFLIKNDLNPDFLVQQWQKRFSFKDFDDIQSNLPAFISVFFKTFRVGGRHLTWDKHVSSYLDKPSVQVIRYEDLLKSPDTELRRALVHLGCPQPDTHTIEAIVERNSFVNKANRQPGIEDKNSFLRKGVAGDWKNHFNHEACKVFDELAGSMLVRLGYELDRNWY